MLLGRVRMRFLPRMNPRRNVLLTALVLVMLTALPPLGKGLMAEVVNKLIGRHLGAVNLFADVILRVIQTPTPAQEICRGRVRGLELSVRMPFN